MARKPRATSRRRAPKRTTSPRGPRRGILAGAIAALAALPRGILSPGGGTWRRRLTVLAALVGVMAATYLLWFRDSSLVAVNDVEVVGITGSERGEIVAELTRVGEGMSTLNVDRERIEEAASAFPIIADVEIDPNFPHGLRIEVAPRRPVLFVNAASADQGGEGALVPVAGDGTILPGLEVPGDRTLPMLEVDGGVGPGTRRLDGDPLAHALVVGAAPGPLLPLIEGIEESKEFGIEVRLRGEIPLRFGGAEDAAAKWTAAAAVLADPKLETAEYIDVRVPERAVAGGNPPPSEEPATIG